MLELTSDGWLNMILSMAFLTIAPVAEWADDGMPARFRDRGVTICHEGARPQQAGAFTNLAYSPDGSTLVATTRGGEICRYGAATAREIDIRRVTLLQSDFYQFVDIPVHPHESQQLLLSHGQTGVLKTIEAITGRQLATFTLTQGRPKWPTCMAFSRDDRLIAFGYDSSSGEIVVVDATTGQLRFRTSPHVVPPGVPPFERTTYPVRAPVTSLLFTSDGSKLLATAQGAPFRAWDVATGAEVAPPIRPARAGRMTASADGWTVVLEDWKEHLAETTAHFTVYNVGNTWAKRSEWVAPCSTSHMAVADGGEFAASIHPYLKAVELRDLADGRLLSSQEWNIPDSFLKHLAMTPDGRQVAVIVVDEVPIDTYGLIKLFNIRGKTLEPWRLSP